MKQKFLVNETKDFNASGLYVKLLENKTQIQLGDMQTLFETGRVEFPVPANTVTHDLLLLLPDVNIDELNAKMAYLQVDAQARQIAEKTKIDSGSAGEQRAQQHACSADLH